MRSGARNESPASELGKGMVPAIRRNHVMSRLCSAVISNHGMRACRAGQVIHDAAFSGIPIAQVRDQDRRVFCFIHFYLQMFHLAPDGRDQTEPSGDIDFHLTLSERIGFSADQAENRSTFLLWSC